MTSNDCFIYQNVFLLTFQVRLGADSNLLHLLLSESGNRVNCLTRKPPLAEIDHIHHVLNFNYYYQKDTHKYK